MLRNLFLAVLFGTIAFAAPAANSPLGAMGAKGSATTLSLPMQIALSLTLMVLLPAALMSITPFLAHHHRPAFPAAGLRHAIYAVQPGSDRTLHVPLPPDPAAHGHEIYHSAWEPMDQGKITASQAFDEGSKPLKTFLAKFAREKDIQPIRRSHQIARAAQCSDLGLQVLIPAYILSELKTGFQIGALLFCPFW